MVEQWRVSHKSGEYVADEGVDRMANQGDGRTDSEEMAAQAAGNNAMNTPEAQHSDGGNGNEPSFFGFTGSYPHSIDAKGRMIIPAAFRDALGARFVVALSPDFQTVALYPVKAWIDRRNELVAYTKMIPKLQDMQDMFTKYSYTDCEADAQGRLLLPQRIRSWRLGDARDVEVNGAYTHIRIVPASVGKEQDASFDDKYPDPLAFLTSLQDEE